MEKPKQPVGRPRGRVAVHKASVYLSDEEYRLARELARARDVSISKLLKLGLRRLAGERGKG